MKFRIIASAVAIAIGATAAASAASSPAKADVPAKAGSLYNICWNDHCLNNWSGITLPGNPIKYYGYNGGSVANNKWAKIWRGYVRNQAPVWPFVDGSGLNTRYNGNSVYVFEWGPNPNYCMDMGNYAPESEAGPVELRACDDEQFQQFVQSGSSYLVPVYANNAQVSWDGNANNIPVFVGSNRGNVGDGAAALVNNLWYTQFFFLPV